jgi:hypothetical protein
MLIRWIAVPVVATALVAMSVSPSLAASAAVRPAARPAVDTSWHESGDTCKNLTSAVEACVWVNYRIDPQLLPTIINQVQAEGQMYDSNSKTYLSIPIVYSQAQNAFTGNWSDQATNSDAQVKSGYSQATTVDGIVTCSEDYQDWRASAKFTWKPAGKSTSSGVVTGGRHNFSDSTCYPTPT